MKRKILKKNSKLGFIEWKVNTLEMLWRRSVITFLNARQKEGVLKWRACLPSSSLSLRRWCWGNAWLVPNSLLGALSLRLCGLSAALKPLRGWKYPWLVFIHKCSKQSICGVAYAMWLRVFCRPRTTYSRRKLYASFRVRMSSTQLHKGPKGHLPSCVWGAISELITAVCKW